MYKEKPSDYKMKFLNINPNYKYLGGIGEKAPEYKRINVDSYLEDESVRKKVRYNEDYMNYENKAIESIAAFHKIRAEISKSDDGNKMIEEKNIEMKIVGDPTNKIYNAKIFGKIDGITKKNIN